MAVDMSNWAACMVQGDFDCGPDLRPSQSLERANDLWQAVQSKNPIDAEYRWDDYRLAIELALRAYATINASDILAAAIIQPWCSSHVPDGTLLSLKARIAFQAGQKDLALELSHSAVNKLKMQNDPRALAEALLFQGQFLMSFSHFDRAIDSLSAALHIFEWQLGEIKGPLRIRNLLSIVHKRRGKWAVAEDVLERTISICEEHGIVDHKLRVLGNLAVLSLKQGKVDKATRCLDTILENAKDSDSGPIFNLAKLTLAIYHRMSGRFARARKEIREVRDWARQNNSARTEILCYEYLADIRQDEGRLAMAVALLGRAVRLARSKCPDTDLVCEVQRRRAEVLVEMNKPIPARRAADHALKVSRMIGEPYEIALAQRASALVEEAAGNTESALQQLRVAEEILRQLGEKFELGRTLLHLARILIRTEGFSAGSEAAEEARKMFSAMRLGFWSKKADAVLLTQPECSVQAAGSDASRERLPQEFGIITRDERIISMFQDLGKISSTDLPVIIEGESGTGKELFAQALHRLSPRASKNFVAVNCGAIPKEMQEAELFGHRRGSFTGAIEDNPGILESANGGTLFLDEIGEMSPSAQVKLLRAIEANEVRRMGERQNRKIDVRYVAATNANISKAIASGDFRKDLFYRLNGLQLVIPPLRERRGDIQLLVQHYLKQTCALLRKQVRITQPVLNLMMSYDWPGNVRELKNSIGRAVTLANPDSELTPALFPFLVDNRQMPLGRTLVQDLEEIERQRIIRALEENGWVKSVTARVLKMTRTTLTSRMERLGIPLRQARKRPPQ